MSLEFGKKVRVGNFYITKHSRSLTRHEIKSLRESSGIGAELSRHLNRCSLPYIKVSTVGENWYVNYSIGMSIYHALDNVTVVKGDDGVRRLDGVEAENVEAILTGMYVDTTTLGDYEYNCAKMRLIQEWLSRASAKAVSEDDAKESDAALDEVASSAEERERLLKISNAINNNE